MVLKAVAAVSIRSRFEVVSYSTVSSKSKSRTIRTLLLLKRKAEVVRIVKTRKKYFFKRSLASEEAFRILRQII